MAGGDRQGPQFEGIIGFSNFQIKRGLPCAQVADRELSLRRTSMPELAPVFLIDFEMVDILTVEIE